jgi:hypothetical protein
VGEDPQQVVQAAVSAANDAQKELNKVTSYLLEVQRHLGNERAPSRARQQLAQARQAAGRARDRFADLESKLMKAGSVVRGRRWL